MYFGSIKKNDIANGEGVRVSLFVSGCRNKCKNCFNPETWNFKYGKEFTKTIEDEIIKSLEPSWINGLTILGGEPFEPENQRDLVEFIKRVKNTYPNKNIWMYSGYLLDKDIYPKDGIVHTDVSVEILKNIDILVDGKFVEELKNLSLKFRGSSNQRIILVKEYLDTNEIVLSPLNEYREFKNYKKP
jgi:anaerobic ribonucleoside-triphosphate reductase activating protein